MNFLRRLFGTAPEPTLDRAAFRSRIFERLSRTNGTMKLPSGSEFLVITRTGKEYSLENIYRSYARDPAPGALERAGLLAERALLELESGPAAGAVLTSEALLPRLLPILRPAEFAKMGGGTPITRLNDELAVFLAVDSEHSLTYANDKILADAALLPGAAYARSLENLRARTEPKVRKMKDAVVYMGAWGDDYDSSRILLKEMFGFFPDLQKVRAAVPSRSRLLFWNADDAAAEAVVRPLIEEFFAQDPGPLSRTPIDL
jgi:uncharacterized protein YtpQ (UPF0354 family)